jgi:hypothetical protein
LNVSGLKTGFRKFSDTLSDHDLIPNCTGRDIECYLASLCARALVTATHVLS